MSYLTTWPYSSQQHLHISQYHLILLFSAACKLFASFGCAHTTFEYNFISLSVSLYSSFNRDFITHKVYYLFLTFATSYLTIWLYISRFVIINTLYLKITLKAIKSYIVSNKVAIVSWSGQIVMYYISQLQLYSSYSVWFHISQYYFIISQLRLYISQNDFQCARTLTWRACRMFWVNPLYENKCPDWRVFIFTIFCISASRPHWK